jgi:hypothetical protein
MRLFKVCEKPTMGPGEALSGTSRRVVVQWDDGSQQEMGVPDVIDDVVAFLSKGQKRKITSWKETAPRSNKPVTPIF